MHSGRFRGGNRRLSEKVQLFSVESYAIFLKRIQKFIFLYLLANVFKSCVKSFRKKLTWKNATKDEKYQKIGKAVSRLEVFDCFWFTKLVNERVLGEIKGLNKLLFKW